MQKKKKKGGGPSQQKASAVKTRRFVTSHNPGNIQSVTNFKWRFYKDFEKKEMIYIWYCATTKWNLEGLLFTQFSVVYNLLIMVCWISFGCHHLLPAPDFTHFVAYLVLSRLFATESHQSAETTLSTSISVPRESMWCYYCHIQLQSFSSGTCRHSPSWPHTHSGIAILFSMWIVKLDSSGRLVTGGKQPMEHTNPFQAGQIEYSLHCF